MWFEIGIFALLLLSLGLLYLIGRQEPGAGLVGSLTSRAPYAFVLRHVIVVGLLLAFFGAVRWYAESNAESKAEAWLNSYMGAETVAAVGSIDLSKPEPSPNQSPTPAATPSPTPTATPSPSPPPTATPEATPFPTPNANETARLDAQLREIRDRIRHHSIVMGYFYINYFVAIVMIMVSSLFVAATLFFIAQKGWTGASSYVESVFIVAAMWAAFYGLFPSVFEQQKNIADNKELFLKYKVLESEVKSYSITHLRLKKDSEANVSPLVPAEFINYVDSEMASLGNIAVGFDPTKISYSDAFSLAKPSPSPSPGKSPPKSGAKTRR